MRMQFAIIIGIVLALYGAINYYIGLRGWQALGKLLPQGASVVWWCLLFLLAVSFFAGAMGGKYLPIAVGNVFTLIGSYWLAVMQYLLFFWLAVDLLRLAHRWTGFIPDVLKQFPTATGLAAVLLVAGIIGYGTWNALHPRVRHYDIVLAKPAGSLQQLRVVMVSDIHMGNIVNSDRVLALVNSINSLHPDLVLLPGDLIDGDIGPFIRQNVPDILRMLKPQYGTFAAFGNHDYLGGDGEEAYRLLQEAGVTVLRDDFWKVDESFYIVGRDDITGQRFRGTRRQELSTLLEGVDRSLPVLLMDHQPYRLEEAQEQGVDLQLSGHTHHGQLFPYNLITKKIFEMDWGYLRKGDFQVIVTCGFGTWGPPVRLGNKPEIVDVTIRFQP